METVNSMAQAAAKAVWGENTTANNETHGQEPISGAQGDTSKGEPFDKGNIDPQPTDPSVHSHEPTSTSTSTTAPITSSNTTTTTDEPHHDAANFAKTTGTAAESDKVPDNKETELKAKDTPADSSKAQNDTRDPENPQTNPKNAPTDVDNTGEGINEGQKLDAPGPKPLDEVAREHGGDAGKTDTTTKGGDADKKDEAEGSEDPNDPHAKSSGEGTGEKYVKTSGLQADGGDFDATKPGAGREADRLLEQKGIHIDKGAPPKPGDDESADKDKDKDSGSGEKKGTFSKIKEKLHRH